VKPNNAFGLKDTDDFDARWGALEAMGNIRHAGRKVFAAVSAVPEDATVESAGGAGLDPTTLGSNVRQETLTKSDQLPLKNIGIETPEAKPLAPTKIVPSSTFPEKKTKKISRHRHNDKPMVATKKSSPRWQAKNGDKRNVDATKPRVQANSCPEGNVLLRTLRLLPSCESSVVAQH
jgi:hypothetical protein